MDKPRLSFWQIWNMSFGFLGIQFGWGLQMANMSPIYKYLGAQDSQIPLLWLAAPLTGFIVQPIIGAMSDRTWGPLGRRRPYFLVGAILSSLALVLMPNCSTLWMAAGLLWILDASINVSMEPFRTFVADKLPEHQHGTGFAMQSFFIGVGAVIAGMLPWMLRNWFHVSSDTGVKSLSRSKLGMVSTIGSRNMVGPVVTSIVVPSGLAPLTALIPINPSAPVRSSTMMVRSSGRLMCWASSRHRVSPLPPGANGKMIFVSGPDWPNASPARAANDAAILPAMNSRRSIRLFPRPFGLLHQTARSIEMLV